MKKKTSYTIVIEGASGVKTTLFGKAWKDVVSTLKALETEGGIIFTDAKSISIRTVEDEINFFKEVTT